VPVTTTENTAAQRLASATNGETSEQQYMPPFEPTTIVHASHMPNHITISKKALHTDQCNKHMYV